MMICKKCKIETDKDYCRICGSHDLIDSNDRYKTFDVKVVGIRYDKVRRAYNLEVIHDNNIYHYYVNTVLKLKPINIPNFFVKIREMKNMSNMKQNEYSSEIFGQIKPVIVITVDMLFDTVCELKTISDASFDTEQFHNEMIKKNIEYDEIFDYYIVDIGYDDIKLVIDRVNNNIYKKIYVYPIIYMNNSWMLITDHSSVITIKKLDYKLYEKLFSHIEEMKKSLKKIVDDILYEAKNTPINKSDVLYMLDVMKGSGRVSGYIISKIIDVINDDMSRYEFVKMLVNAMNYTDGHAVKKYVATKSGKAILGKF